MAHFHRRGFMQTAGAAAIAARLSLPELLRARTPDATSTAGFGNAKRCVLLFLTGGPPQLDTFDLKPQAPAEIRGELRPIATCVPGIQIGELCPNLARQADKFCIVRSVTHPDTVHTSAGYTMLTGAPHPQANGKTARDIHPSPDDHPHLGALLAKFRPPRGGEPAFAAMPEIIKDAAINEFPGQGAGFLGKQFDPFRIEADEPRTGFRLPDIVLPPNMTARRLDDRQQLLARLDRVIRAGDDAVRNDVAGVYERAFNLIRSPAVSRAFRLDHEPPRTRTAYGPHLFGQGCLLARRLLEAGIPLATVYWQYEGPDDSPVWDTHENNFPHLRRRLLPPADQAVAALLDDLSARGMLGDTLVICMGEFGRTPRVNKKGGRDHWPHVQSILLAGAGIRGGSVYGSSDRIGAYPATSPVTPLDLMATFLHLLGIPPESEVHDRTGRPLAACAGTVVRGLL